jgi:flagellin
MLNRMTELAEQSANGTYENTVDRKNLEDELAQLKEEVTRVASATNFNGITLLNGSLNAKIDDLAGTTFTIANGGNLATAQDVTDGKATRADGIKGVITATGGFTLTNAQISKDAASKTSGITVTVTQTDLLKDNSNAGKKGIYKATITMDKTKVSQQDYEKWNGVEITVDTRNSTATAAQTLAEGGTGAISHNGSLSLQIGDTSDPFNKLKVSVSDMSSKGLGIESAHVSDQTSASNALAVFKTAINTVSSTRGTLGAMQNRLEHTINNLSTTNENITNAESRIRDTDMAKEMMTFTSKSILSQAAQSMLAQANQQPQQVLSLLQ